MTDEHGPVSDPQDGMTGGVATCQTHDDTRDDLPRALDAIDDTLFHQVPECRASSNFRMSVDMSHFGTGDHDPGNREEGRPTSRLIDGPDHSDAVEMTHEHEVDLI